LAGALNFQLQGGAGERRTPKEQILDYLHQKRMLLIMDNREHLLDGGALLVDVLHTAPEVQIMATSRERLHLREEQVYPIEGLEFPDWEPDTAHADAAHPTDVTEYSAVKLFLQSARRAQPRFEAASDDVAALTRICRLLGGMPLAIEIAAGWTQALSLDRIAAEIQKGLDFLETDVRAVPERHRSMQVIIDPTWERLSQTEQETFAALSVFRGGFTLEAAAAVAGANLRTLLSLVNKSLLGFNRRRDRYDVHELLRQYAAEKLATNPDGEVAVRIRHSAYDCTALGEWEADLKSARQGTAVAEIEADYENVRVAWMRAVEGADLHENLGNLALAVNGLGEFHHAQLRWSEGGTVFQKAAEKLQALYGPSPATAIAARLLARFLAWQFSLNLT
jgi:predicted ATPase